MAIIQFSEEATEVTLSFDSGKVVEGKYGTQYMWSCDEGDVFYASEQFNALLNALSVTKGQTVSIKKVKKVDANGEQLKMSDGTPVLVFCVDGQTIDTLSAPIGNTPLEVGFAHKDTKANNGSTLSVEERLSRIEKEMNIENTTAEKTVQPLDEELPF